MEIVLIGFAVLIIFVMALETHSSPEWKAEMLRLQRDAHLKK